MRNLKKRLDEDFPPEEEFPPLGSTRPKSKNSRRSEGAPTNNNNDKNGENRRKSTGSRNSEAREIKITIQGKGRKLTGFENFTILEFYVTPKTEVA